MDPSITAGVDAGGAADPTGLWAEAAALITQRRRLPHSHRLYKGVGSGRGGVKRSIGPFP